MLCSPSVCHYSRSLLQDSTRVRHTLLQRQVAFTLLKKAGSLMRVRASIALAVLFLMPPPAWAKIVISTCSYRNHQALSLSVAQTITFRILLLLLRNRKTSKFRPEHPTFQSSTHAGEKRTKPWRWKDPDWWWLHKSFHLAESWPLTYLNRGMPIDQQWPIWWWEMI